MNKLNIPISKPKDFGVSRQHVEELVSKVRQVSAALQQNRQQPSSAQSSSDLELQSFYRSR